MKWADVEARCKAAGLSNGEFCRRCGLSESAMNKGLRRGSRLSAAVRALAIRVLEQAEQEAAA